MHLVKVAGLRQPQSQKVAQLPHTAPVHSPTVVCNLMKKNLTLNPKLILIESIGFFFVIQGSRRLNISYNSEKWENVIQFDQEKIGGISDVSQFFFEISIWSTYTLVFLTILTLLIKLITKQSIGNTLISSSIVFALFPSGIMGHTRLSQTLNSLGYYFSNELKMAFLAGGILLASIGLILLWYALKKTKLHTT
ncbi:hypothetical protein E7Z59_07130 [Robertkochia marina]|uniref:Uncharacterized protein n=1 Tax=Robertkochia marina TaxID=1227945 RepID=A0A4S3LZU1_9FLAO|nr:hypothetical protein [Robertkochia marina]THD67428.1 hypothetical protein E7Z59_07130 [Robertkochia marina]TRZ40783.1 hypothetical protein D3A96_15330 [Robertkochia marina]